MGNVDPTVMFEIMMTELVAFGGMTVHEWWEVEEKVVESEGIKNWEIKMLDNSLYEC